MCKHLYGKEGLHTYWKQQLGWQQPALRLSVKGRDSFPVVECCLGRYQGLGHHFQSSHTDKAWLGEAAFVLMPGQTAGSYGPDRAVSATTVAFPALTH